jgi:hypothetical protein
MASGAVERRTRRAGGEHRRRGGDATEARQRPLCCVQRGVRVWRENGSLVLVAVVSFMLALQRAEGQDEVKMKCYEGVSYSRCCASCLLPSSALLRLPPPPLSCRRLPSDVAGCFTAHVQAGRPVARGLLLVRASTYGWVVFLTAVCLQGCDGPCKPHHQDSKRGTCVRVHGQLLVGCLTQPCC